MIQVLVAVADIISIGDLVLDVSREYLQLQLKTNNGIQAATAATPAFVCNAIVKELGLEWGEISPNIIKKEYIYPKKQTEEYGLLLFMIAEKSGVFEAEQVVNENGDVVKDSSILPEMRSGSCTWRSKYRIKQKDRVSGRTILEELMEEEGAEDVFETRKKKLVVKWLEGWDCFTSVEEIKKLKEKKEEEEKNKKEENEGRKERRFQIVESGTYNGTHTVP